MRVLLTGCSGYVGSVARGVLEAAGHEVVGLDTGLYEGCDLAPLPAPAAVPSFSATSATSQLADLDGIDAVVHLAALSNDPLGEFDESLTYAINHEASVRARASSHERREPSASSSLRRAACTARRDRRLRSTRQRRSRR